MKSPNYRPSNRPGSRSDLPTRPDQTAQPNHLKRNEAAKLAKPAKVARPAKFAKTEKVAKSSKASQIGNAPVVVKVVKPRKPANSIPRSQLLREQRRLAAIRNASKSQKLQQSRDFASDIKRFTQASRKRRIAAWVSVGSVGTLFAILLATWFTPILAIEKISISGLDRLREKSVAKAVEGLIGTPLTLVDESAIAQRLSAFALIESFSTVANPPHVLELRIVERQPIAIVQIGDQLYLYDAAGVQVGLARESDRLPIVDITGNPAKSENYRQAIDVLLSLPIELNNKVSSIKALSKDNVQLALTGGTSRVVIWGDSSESILKSKVLSALLKTTRKSESVVFDVSSPNAPAVRYLNY